MWLWDADAGYQKLNDTLSRNFFISNYDGQEAVGEPRAARSGAPRGAFRAVPAAPPRPDARAPSVPRPDNDDGSSYYHTHHNLLVYSGNGAKADFGGHDMFSEANVYGALGLRGVATRAARPRASAPPSRTAAYIGQGYGFCPQLANHSNAFASNVVFQAADGDYGSGTCSGDGKTIVFNNSIYTPTGRVTECGMTLAQWQAQGNDPGTTAAPYVSDEQLLSWGRTVIGLGDKPWAWRGA